MTCRGRTIIILVEDDEEAAEADAPNRTLAADDVRGDGHDLGRDDRPLDGDDGDGALFRRRISADGGGEGEGGNPAAWGSAA